jgi:hypothetical protein
VLSIKRMENLTWKRKGNFYEAFFEGMKIGSVVQKYCQIYKVYLRGKNIGVCEKLWSAKLMLSHDFSKENLKD